MNSVSQLDWVTSNSGSSSDNSQSILSDESTLVDDSEDSSSIVLDVSELSGHDSLVSSDHLDENNSSVTGGGLQNSGVSLDLVDNNLNDSLSVEDNFLSLRLDSLIVTGLLDRLSLGTSLDDVQNSSSIGSDVSLLSSDNSGVSSDLTQNNSSSLSAGNSSEISSVISDSSSDSSHNSDSRSDDSSGSRSDVLRTESGVSDLSRNNASPNSRLSSSVKFHTVSDNSNSSLSVSSDRSELSSDDSSPSSDSSSSSS